ncbi:Lipid A export ATP-binding/permease protein MsbA [Clostridiaceae bacterium JG1575]|nr:Lipid A export ATP-binding/permease protein MsbA [Clostridiaceae bacterium JG1575]
MSFKKRDGVNSLGFNPFFFPLGLASANTESSHSKQPIYWHEGVILLKQQSNRARLMAFAGKHRYLTYASWILAASSALFALVPYLYLWRILRAILEAGDSAEALAVIPQYGWMAFLFAVLTIFVYLAALLCSHFSAFRIASNMRSALMHHIVALPLGTVDRFGSGRMRSIVNESTAATENYLAHQLPDRSVAIATPLGLLVLLLAFDWRLGLLSLVPVVLGMIFLYRMMGPDKAERMTLYTNTLEDMSNEAVEFVRGVPVVKTFGQTVFSFRRLKGAIDRYGDYVMSYTKMSRLPMVGFMTAIHGIFALLIFAGIYFSRQGTTLGFVLNLFFYILITPVISLTLEKVIFQSHDALIVKDALERMDSILHLPLLEEGQTPESFQDSSLELDHVTFSYDGTNEALKDVSLFVKSGETVALVGPSGGGKTTLAHLLCRFYDPQSGSVRVGGIDVRKVSSQDLMNQVSFVFQNSRLLKGTLLENVRLGRPEATQEDVLAALAEAQCMDIVEKLPQGIHTLLGTKGAFLSGGEEQRVAIARTLLKNSPIVLLDEATAFADPDNEHKVQEAFKVLAANRTVLMIAHRLTTIAHVDRVFVVREGRIVEEGSVPTLMEKGGVFAAMWQQYEEAVEWKVEREEVQ